MTPMRRSALALLVLVVLLGAAGCAGGGLASSARGGCYEQPSAGSQGYDVRPMFFLFCRQSP
jgi:ABC-type glycerol-3-phosphate transport system substrate-binding protein